MTQNNPAVKAFAFTAGLAIYGFIKWTMKEKNE